MSPRILVVDDNPANLLAIETILEGSDVVVVKAASGADALKLSLNGAFALVLLDVEMPGMDGYETATYLRTSTRTREIPIIFVTASHADKQDVFRGYESGAVDYILKPLNPVILKSKVKVFAELFMLKEQEKRGIVQEENAKLKTVLDNMLTGVAMAEAPSGRIVFINERLRTIYGAGFAARTYRKDGQPFGADDAMLRALKGELINEEEVVYVLDDGSRRTTIVNASPVRDNNGNVTHAIISVLDVTSRVTAEEARETARQQLQQSYKMSALGEMAGGIAHEVNNPLSIIIGKARQLRELLENGRGTKDQHVTFAKIVEETSHRIVKIVGGLRMISRSSDKDPCVPTPVSSIIEGTMAICASRAKYETVEVTTDIGGSKLAIECRAAEISQVLLNLIGNAIDAVAGLKEKWVRVTCLEQGDWVEIAVEDSGSGIKPDIREKILEPFFTTKEAGKGTGLGLSISKSLVVDHGGHLTLDADAAHTRFVVRLPKTQNVSQAVHKI